MLLSRYLWAFSYVYNVIISIEFLVKNMIMPVNLTTIYAHDSAKLCRKGNRSPNWRLIELDVAEN